MQDIISVVHNKVPNRLRLYVPMLRHKQTYAEMLKQTLLHHSEAKGIYHAEANIITGTILIKYHPAFHNEAQILDVVHKAVRSIQDGKIEISLKHKNPRLGKMKPAAFFTRELLVGIGGNIIAGVLLAFMLGG